MTNQNAKHFLEYSEGGEFYMIIDRALEILNSKENIRVLYANDPVWIESVDTENRKATVSIVGTAQTMEVMVSSLTDTGSQS